jgi:ribosomal protein S21
MDSDLLTLRDNHVPLPKPVRDMPAVEVHDNDIERAIRILGKATGRLGIFRALKMRKMNPSTQARARRKAVEAASRRRRLLAKKGK